MLKCYFELSPPINALLYPNKEVCPILWTLFSLCSVYCFVVVVYKLYISKCQMPKVNDFRITKYHIRLSSHSSQIHRIQKKEHFWQLVFLGWAQKYTYVHYTTYIGDSVTKHTRKYVQHGTKQKKRQFATTDKDMKDLEIRHRVISIQFNLCTCVYVCVDIEILLLFFFNVFKLLYEKTLSMVLFTSFGVFFDGQNFVSHWK